MLEPQPPLLGPEEPWGKVSLKRETRGHVQGRAAFAAGLCQAHPGCSAAGGFAQHGTGKVPSGGNQQLSS